MSYQKLNILSSTLHIAGVLKSSSVLLTPISSILLPIGSKTYVFSLEVIIRIFLTFCIKIGHWAMSYWLQNRSFYPTLELRPGMYFSWNLFSRILLKFCLSLFYVSKSTKWLFWKISYWLQNEVSYQKLGPKPHMQCSQNSL